MAQDLHDGAAGRDDLAGRLVAGDLTGRIIGLAMKVHRAVGPGLLEHIYVDCLCHELVLSGLAFAREVELSMVYAGTRLPRAYRADIVVVEQVILEIKSIETILPVHESQLLTYLRLSGCCVGLLLNFNTALLKNGMRRVVLTGPPRQQ